MKEEKNNEDFDLAAAFEALAKEMKENPVKYLDEVEYPLEIKGVDMKFRLLKNGIGANMGDLVSIRYCKDNKTYLGFYIGDLAIETFGTFRPKTSKIEIMAMHNPAMFVPELGKIIYGVESWWKKIESPEELEEITDEDIENVWYMKILKSRLENYDNEE